MSRPAIFITGAAAGIGRACAERFAREGWFVGLYDIDGAGVETLQAQLGASTGHAGVLDVTDPAAWRHALADFCSASGGRLDVLLNNAGIAVPGDFAEVALERHRRVVDINLLGVMNGCHAALSYLKQTPGARVINMGSASALYGQPEIASYSATKFAVRGFTEALNLEWWRHGIRVMDVLPLYVRTDMAKTLGAVGSLRFLGSRLTPPDVAAVVWTAANAHLRGIATHWPVGGLTRLLMLCLRLAPDVLARWAVRRIAGR